MVTTTCSRPIRAAASATRSGSCESGGPGRRVSTRQKPHARVHRSPRIMKVAGAVVPALRDIGAAGLLADRHQVEAAQRRADLVERRPGAERNPHPLRLARPVRHRGRLVAALQPGLGQPAQQPQRGPRHGHRPQRARRSRTRTERPSGPGRGCGRRSIGRGVGVGRAVGSVPGERGHVGRSRPVGHVGPVDAAVGAPSVPGSLSHEVHDLAHRRVDALGRQRRDSPDRLSRTARSELNQLQVGIDVEREAVHGAGPRQPHPDGGDLAGTRPVRLDPHPGVAVQPPGGPDPDRRARRSAAAPRRPRRRRCRPCRRPAGRERSGSDSRRAGPVRGR